MIVISNELALTSLDRIYKTEENVQERLNSFENKLISWHQEAVRLSNQMNGISRQLEKHAEMFKVLNEALLSRNNHGDIDNEG